jgi:hypothetical protein
MKTDILTSENIRRHSFDLCRLALPLVLAGPGHVETWVGVCGDVIVADDGQAWAGDLCYMREKFGWTHADYMTAYGAPENRGEGYKTDRLQVHTFGDRHILVINLGGDGAGPFGTGIDSGSFSFVSTDRARIEAAAAACIAHMEGMRPQLEEAARIDAAMWERLRASSPTPPKSRRKVKKAA